MLAGAGASRGWPGSRRHAQPAPAIAAKAELPFDDQALESRLVWIMGAPRTGSTWLLRMLIHPWILAHKSLTGMRAPLRRSGSATLPDVVAIDESYLLHHLTPLRPVGADYEDQPDPDPADLLLNSRRADVPGYFFSDAFAEAWRPELRRLILARFWSGAETASREHSLTDPMVLIKEPNGSHGAQVLLSLLPRSRLLFVLRDGRDVVDSMIDAAQAWAPNIRDLSRSAERLGYVRAQSRLWLNFTTAVQRAHDAHPRELRRTVRYERLRAEPERELAPVLDWLGLDSAPEHVRDAVEANAFEALPSVMKGSGTPRRAATPGLWRENTTPEEQEVMHEVMGPKLAEMGYQVS
jgi:hypothetical protein